MKKMCNFATYCIKVRRRQLITNNKNIKKMKKLIALALFAISALTVSAQSVQIIEKNGIKDTDVAAAIADYPYVSPEDLKDIVAEINDKVGKKEYTREEALSALDEAAALLEIQAGDANLDGKINVADVNVIIGKSKSDYDAKYDLNGDGKVNVADVNYVIAQSKK